MIAGYETHDVDVYRPTFTEEGPGDDARSFPSPAEPHVVDCAVAINHLSAGRAQRQFGVNTEAQYEVVFDRGVDIVTDDVLKIKAGGFGVGQNILMLDVRLDDRQEAYVGSATQTNDGPP